MKTKILVLLLLAFSSVSIAQTTLANKLKITGNTTSETATKVNVQEANGEINTIAKTDLINVVEALNYASLPVTGVAGKIYVTTSTNKTYRWNGTSYGELAITDISGKVDKVTGKSLILDSEITRLASLANQDISIKEDKSNKAIANGYASLDNNGKVPLNQVNDALLGAVNYKGTYNAATNTPTLPNVSSSNKGWYYVVDTGGTAQSITFKAGDWIISNGTAWGRVDNNNAVASVNSKVGAVTLTKTDIGLSNVDNTTDLLKPISTAMQTALNGKLSISGGTLTGGLIGTTATFSSVVSAAQRFNAISGQKQLYLYNDGTSIKLDAYDYSTSEALSFDLGGNGGSINAKGALNGTSAAFSSSVTAASLKSTSLAGTGDSAVGTDSAGNLKRISNSESTSGSYNPTYSNLSNVSSLSGTLLYTKIGNIVSVSGRIFLSSTSNSLCSFDLTVPISAIASLPTSSIGIANRFYNNVPLVGNIIGASSSTVNVKYTSNGSTGTSDGVYVSFMYQLN